MTERTARTIAWIVGGTSIALLAAALVAIFIDRAVVLPDVSDHWSLRTAFDLLVNAGVPILGIVIASRRHENPIGWLFLLAGVALGVGTFSRAYALHALLADPGSLPAGRAFGWVSNWIWPIPIGMMPFLFLLFPTGHLPTRRWRPVAWFSGAILAVLLATTSVFATVEWSRPFEDQRAAIFGSVAEMAKTVFFVALIALPVALFASFASVAIRFARASGDERLQLKWFVTSAAVVAATFSATIVTNSPLGSLVFDLALILLYASIGIAILKHRLYDIDVLINKTLVYGLLGAFITVVYVLVVVVVGAFIGATELLSLVATAVVAIAFQPARERAKHTANRLVYGKRATPYEILSDFSQHVSETYAGEDILPRMARLLAEGTGASNATVWLRVGQEIRPVASWPQNGDLASARTLVADELPAFDDVDRAEPVRHQGELLGALTVTKPSNDPILPAEEKLVTDLAAQAGLVMQNFRLIEDLRSSRQRLVAAHDEERRRLERNLHDGAQQQLVSLAVRVRLAEGLVGGDEQAQRDALNAIQVETQDALDTLRDLARGIYPPLLADRGLAAALEAQARKTPVPVTLDVADVGRYAPDVEAAVYFCVLEALQNVAKYAEASNVVVRLREERGDLVFSVADDGRGFDRSTTPLGMGLQNMADRLAALGGALDIRTRPEQGTDVRGRIGSVTSR